MNDILRPLLRLIFLIAFGLFLPIASSIGQNINTLYVGGNIANQTASFTSGNYVYNGGANVGGASGQPDNGFFQSITNNLLSVSGAGVQLTFTNFGGFEYPVEIGIQGSENSLVISNGGGVIADVSVIEGVYSSSSNNSILVTGPNSLLSVLNNAPLIIGYDGSENSLVISNAGEVTVNGQYSGGLQIGQSSSSSNNSILVTGSNSALNVQSITDYGANDTLTVANGGVINCANTLNMGAGTVNFGGYGGSDKVTSNAITASSIFIAGGSLNFNQTNSYTLSVSISGFGSLNQLGSGTTILPGDNVFDTTTLVHGSLSVSSGNFDGNTLNFGTYGGTDSVSASVLATPGITFVNGSGTLNFNQANSCTLTSSITGGIALNQLGSGTTILPGDNVFDTTTLVHGSLSVSSGNFDGNTLNFGTYGGTDSVSASLLATPGITFVSGSGTLNFNQANSYTLTNSITGGIALNQLGSGTTILPGNVGVSTTTVDGGTLAVSGSLVNTNTLIIGNSNSGILTIVGGGSVEADEGVTIASNSNSSGTLNFGTYGGTDSIQDNALLTPGVTFGSGSGTLNFNQANSYTLTSSITGGIALNQLGSGTTILPGNVGLATTTVDGGTLAVSGSLVNTNTLIIGNSNSGILTIVGGGSVEADEGVTIASNSNSSGTLNFGTYGGTDNGSTLITPTIIFGSGSGTLNFNQSDTTMLTSSISGIGLLAQLGSGITILSGSNNYGGITLVSAGTLIAGSTNAFGSSTVTLNGGTLSSKTNATISTLVLTSGGTVALTNTGETLAVTNSLTLSGSNNLVKISSSSAVLSISNDLTIGINGTNNTLTISSGGIVSNGQSSNGGVIGFATTASNNSVLVTGSGSRWSNSVNLTIGYDGSGNSLVISNAGTARDSNGYIGYTTNASNDTALVTGISSLWSNSGSLYVGSDGSGNSLTISNSGSVKDSNGYIGYTTNASNDTVQVTGSGSLWNNSGSLYVGSDGSGNSLTISNTGSVKDSNGYIGYTTNASNDTVLVTGTNSLWSNSGSLYVGSDGSGNSLTISNAGTARDSNGYIGYTTNASNDTVLVTGTNSLWTNSSVLTVGSDGSGNSLTISNKGSVKDSNGYIGYTTNASNDTVLVTGTNSLWTNSGLLSVGYAGSSNSLLISSAGSARDSNGYIGYTTNASNDTALVTGAGSLWTNSGALTVGSDGSGNSLTISNAGSVKDSNGYIGYTTNASNDTVLVTGTSSLWSNSGALTVGSDGSGNNLVISNAGSVKDFNGNIGYTTNASNNTALVTGTSSLWSNSGALTVGYDGSSNSLVISNAGSAIDLNGYIGYTTNSSNNTALVTGSNSLWGGSSIKVGYDGSSNSLVISNAGSSIDSGGYIGYTTNSSNNTALVTGTGSTWSNSTLSVGYNGSGNSLVISNGGVVADYSDYLGYNSSSSNNSVLVTGNNSLWSNRYSQLVVGVGGSSNSVVVANGGEVSDGSSVSLGANSSNNTMLVSGSNSLLTTSELDVGYDGVGNSLIVTNGGTVNTAYAYIGYINPASNNSVLVTGSNSLFTNSGDLVIGYYGSSNSMVVSEGGTVINGMLAYGGVIGYTTNSSNNSVLVTGSNSLWSNSGTLTIGYSGQGTLTVANGGAIAAANLVIASNSGSVGTLNFGTPGGTDSVASNSLITPSLTFGSGTGTINFNQANTAMLTSSITGPGTLNQLGSGTTILSGSNSYTGPTTVSAGTLEFANKYSLYNGDNTQWTASNLTVRSNATIGFNVGTTAANPFTTNDITTLLNNLAIGSPNSGLEIGSIFGIDATGTTFTFTNNLPSTIGIAALGGTLNFVGTNTLTSLLVNGGSSSFSGYTILQTDLSVGTSGSGTLTLNPGAIFVDQNGYIDEDPGSTGTVSVNGSLWSNSGTVLVGNSGTGTLNILGSGVVVADAGVTIALNSSSVGTLNFGTFGGTDNIASNALITPSITFGNGTGTINFNQANTYTLTSSITGPGSVNLLGSGTTILTGSNSYTGPTTVLAGTLLVGNTAGSATGLGTLTVNEGALLGGSGTIGGDAIISGNLTPGSGVNRGLISFAGSLIFGSNAVTTLTLNPGLSTNSVAGTDYDALNISGTLTYNGILKLVDNSPSVGIFNLFGVRSTSGNFDQVSLGASWFTLNGGLWKLSENTYNWIFDPGSGDLTVTMVPEPSVDALLGLGALTLLGFGAWSRNRKRRLLSRTSSNL
jgi:T5SS/PEP-CTERM-associated repeat protein/autotransporter-associated beta strand protein